MDYDLELDEEEYRETEKVELRRARSVTLLKATISVGKRAARKEGKPDGDTGLDELPRSPPSPSAPSCPLPLPSGLTHTDLCDIHSSQVTSPPLPLPPVSIVCHFPKELPTLSSPPQHPQATAHLLPPTPTPAFRRIPVLHQPLTLVQARDQLSSSEMQSIISLAVSLTSSKSSPSDAFPGLRLLPLELMSSVIPREMEELRRRQDELRKAYADVAKQRGKVLKYLNESSGTSEGKTGRVATGLAGLARDGDLIAEEVRLVSFSRSSSSPSVLL
jgi:hypothetical protein